MRFRWIGATGGVCIDTDEVVVGLTITGNEYHGATALRTIQPSGSSSALAWFITGNSYVSVTTPLSGNFASGTIYHDSQVQTVTTGLALYGARMNGDLVMVSGNNLSFSTVIGTSATQKIGFFNATPIVQPTGTPAAATDPATTQALVNSIRLHC